jgi:hypothetical protein
MDNDNKLRAWVLVVGVLGIMVVSAFVLIWIIRSSFLQAQQAVQPINDLTSDVATQISQFTHPTPTILPDPVTIVHDVRSLARLETIQYSIEKVITAETSQGPLGFLFGDRLLLVAHGEVIAGLDLSQMSPDDLWVEDQVLHVRLPEPEIFIATLDNDRTYVYDRETGILRQRDITLETSARQAAEKEIESAALEDGILEQARQNGEVFMMRLLLDLGYPDVIFVQPTPVP